MGAFSFDGGGSSGGGGLRQQVGMMMSFRIGLLPSPHRHRSGSSCPKYLVSASKLAVDEVMYFGLSGNVEILSGGSLGFAANNPGNILYAPGYSGIVGLYQNGLDQEIIFSSYEAGLATQMGTWQAMNET